MSFLLDTNICAAHLRRPAGLTHRFIQHSGRLSVPSIVLAELYVWAYQRNDPKPFLEAIATLIREEAGVLPYDERCAETFGQVQSVLRPRGVTVSPMDLLIASVALTHDLTLVTHNTSDFHLIPGLRLEDWLTP